jgi:uncharacterized membrane protein
MSNARNVVLLRLALLVAVAASATLWVEYQNAGDPAFCGAGSGCMEVRKSPYSRVGPVPLPAIGLIAYAVVFGLSLLARTRAHHRAVAALSLFGGSVAVGLVALQALAIGAFCKWCVAVDVAAMVAAAMAALIWIDTRSAAAERAYAALAADKPAAAAWTVAALAAVSLPFVWSWFPVAPAPPPQLAALGVSGKVSVLQFTDFECPHCRNLHKVVDRMRERHGDRIHFVRLMMPLSGHRGAMPAALAYACAPENRRDAVAAKLYAAPPGALSRGGAAELAGEAGLDPAAVGACMDAPEARERVDKDMNLFKDVEGAALPLTYVGGRAVLGYNPTRLEKLLASALDPPLLGLPAWAMLAALSVVFAGAAAATLARASKTPIPPEKSS